MSLLAGGDDLKRCGFVVEWFAIAFVGEDDRAIGEVAIEFGKGEDCSVNVFCVDGDECTQPFAAQRLAMSGSHFLQQLTDICAATLNELSFAITDFKFDARELLQVVNALKFHFSAGPDAGNFICFGSIVAKRAVRNRVDEQHRRQQTAHTDWIGMERFPNRSFPLERRSLLT